MTRTEYWAMDPVEVWWVIEARQPPQMFGSLTEHDAAELVEECKSKGYL